MLAQRRVRHPLHPPPRPAPSLPRYRHTRLPPARTSEFWYDDEDEFDGVAADVRAKTVVLVPVPASADTKNSPVDDAWVAHTRSRLQDVRFDACFCSAHAETAAAHVWEGRSEAGPPLFLKPRVRSGLDSASTMDAWWGEVAGQNWRVSVGGGVLRRGR